MFRQFVGASGAALVLAMSATTAAQAQAEKAGSLHLQCDGQPNNMTGGEQAARLIGAVTLLALFAPPPETADASKRKKGAEGVAACSALIDGARAEGNPKRRIGLILGRAIHQVEAKNYPAALADVSLARSEAEAAGFTNDVFYMRTRGRAFDNLESAILARMGRFDEARTVGLRSAQRYPYYFATQLTALSYGSHIRQPTTTEIEVIGNQGKLYPLYALAKALRLESAGQFADAAVIYDAMAEDDTVNTPELVSSRMAMQAAVAYGLAGNMALADQRLATAKANIEARKAAGNADKDQSDLVELEDFLAIVRSANNGDVAGARRLFSGRSRWTAPTNGAVIALTDRLRNGAPSSDLVGALAKTGDMIWQDEAAEARARMTAKDAEGSLFGMVPAETNGSALRSLSKVVWNVEKSKLLLKLKSPSKTQFEYLFYTYASGLDALDAYLLHAALLAQSRGHQGFIFNPILEKSLVGAAIRTGNRGTRGMPDTLFLDAQPVIAALRPIIPSPADIKAQEKALR